jgi:helicase required for RNAi-mediated heterochromatin assembly 1
MKKLEKKAKSQIELAFTNLLDPDEFVKAGVITQQQRDSLGDPTGEGYRTVPKDGPYVCDSNPNGELAMWLKQDLIRPQVFVYKTPQSQIEAAVEDRDIMKDQNVDLDDEIQGEYVAMCLGWTSRVHPQLMNDMRTVAETELAKGDLYDILPPYRGTVFKVMQEDLIESRMAGIRSTLQEYQNLAKGSVEDRFEADALMLRRLKVQLIGCTTTGLGKYRRLLSQCAPSILLIEEAAETWEANITSGLLPSLQQLILVGDHVQLSPRCDMKELNQDPFNFNKSLFERLVEIGLPHTMLSSQRRMITTLRRNFDMHYRGLTDHESVKELQPVPGMLSCSSWWVHRHLDAVNASGSRYNYEEAIMVVGVYRHLVKNLVPVNKITILTFYRGQQAVIQKLIRGDSVLDPTSVRTVDGYQGEENDVILLSLVRSKRNGKSQIGFLNEANRVVVALSRARRGLYIFGDSQNLRDDKNASKVWGPVIQRYVDRGRHSSRLPLRCSKHGSVRLIETAEDWRGFEGVCDQPCGGSVCAAGHACTRKCHP